MKYFFVLGNHPQLSLAELEAVLGKKKDTLITKQVALFSLDEEVDTKFLERIGGTIKFGKIINDNIPFRELEDYILDYFANLDKEYFSSKFHFGISDYVNSVDLKKLGLSIKKGLKNEGVSCRWVSSQERILSSVVVEQNHLLGRGVEINIFKSGSNLVLGHTIGVQPFKDLSKRDYGRPARDDHSGMIPPKLAQMMLNIGGLDKNSVLLDPFCGSGTILNEAILLGAKKVIGSDVSEKAVEDTEENIGWLQEELGVRDFSFSLFHESAVNISSVVKKASVDLIVTEPYLGEQRGRVDINRQLKELNELYGRSLAEFYKVLKPKSRVVMIWPIFMNYRQAQLEPSYNGFRMIAIGENEINRRPSLVYGRPGQKVWREIVLLEKED